MAKRLTLLLVILFLLKLQVGAQRYNITRYGVKEGLLHSFVSDLTQDERGNLWVATGAGLSQFNGVEFNHYTTKDGLSDTRLTCLATDDYGNIWTGSYNGVNFFNGEKIYSLVDKELGKTVLAITAYEGSNVWVATENGLSLVSFANGKLSFDRIRYDFKTPDISIIFQDRSHTSFLLSSQSGDLFYGNNGYLFRIHNRIIESISADEGISVNSGTEMPDGTLLFATNRGVYMLVESKLVEFKNKYVQSFNLSRILHQGEKLWMLGQNEELQSSEMFLLALDVDDQNFFRIIGKSNGLIESPTSLFIDHENNIWTGSDGGLSVLKGRSFITFTKNDGLIGNRIWALCQTSDKNLWIGTIGEGLTIKSQNRFYRYDKQNGLPDLYIGRVYQDQSDRIYIGTSNAGLNRAYYNKMTGRYFFKKLPLLPNVERLRIDDIFRDNNKKLWVASLKGLYFSYNDKDFYHFPLFEGDTGQVFVQKLVFDTLRDRIWVGTRSNGVFFIDNDIAHRFDSIPHNEQTTSLCQDKVDGNIWIGTRTRGVYRVSQDGIAQFTDRNGLASNLVYILFSDSYGNLWIGTNLGLDKLNLKSLREGKAEFRHYNSDDGLLDMETNLNGVIEDHEGYIWFANNGGLLRYDQKYDVSNQIPPKINLLEVKLHSRETDWREFEPLVNSWNGLPTKLNLNYYQNHLTFNFVGISFKNPKEIIYMWKLEGFDNTWVQGGTNRQAIYSNLRPGQYVFKIKAANSDKVWSEVETISFVINPPFWETWWFWILAVCIFLLIVYLFVLWKTRNFKARQKELQKIVELRTSEISKQLRIIDKKNHQILDSISYAKFLQNAILPSASIVYNFFNDVLILNKPKDVVSGDFYWFQNQGKRSVLAVADCTGHGVPGAIVSVVCSNALTQAVRDCPSLDPALILERTRTLVIETFSHGYEEVRDGMDVALVVFDHQSNDLTFAGANSGLYVLTNNQLVKLKPDIQHIGQNLKTKPFTNQTINLQKNDLVFMLTDGYTDQLGSENRKKFSQKRLEEILYQNAHLKLHDLSGLLEQRFHEWKGEREQTDDLVIIGVRI